MFPQHVFVNVCLYLFSSAKKGGHFPFFLNPLYSLQRFSGDGDDVLRRGLHSCDWHRLLLHHRPGLLSVRADENHRCSAGWEWGERSRTQLCFSPTGNKITKKKNMIFPDKPNFSVCAPPLWCSLVQSQLWCGEDVTKYHAPPGRWPRVLAHSGGLHSMGEHHDTTTIFFGASIFWDTNLNESSV